MEFLLVRKSLGPQWEKMRLQRHDTDVGKAVR